MPALAQLEQTLCRANERVDELCAERDRLEADLSGATPRAGAPRVPGTSRSSDQKKAMTRLMERVAVEKAE